MTPAQRKALKAVIEFVEAQPSITLSQAIYALEARGFMIDAADSRQVQLEEAMNPDAQDPDPEVAAEDLADAKAWSAADECEAQRDGNLDEPRDYVIFDFEQIQDVGNALFRRDWHKAAK